jgi:inosine/xanthosine triphosphate pyrophosphatase family protein
MKLRTPIKTLHKNMMLTKSGDLYVLYRFDPEMIATSNHGKLEQSKDSFKNLLLDIKGYKDIHLQMMPRYMELRSRFDHMEKDFSPKTKHIGKYYNEETISMLEDELGSISEYEFILTVRLKSKLVEGNVDMKEVVSNAFSSVTDTLVNLLHLERDVSDQFFDRFAELEQELFAKVSMLPGASRLKEDHVYYLNRYNFLRDMQHSIQDEMTNRGISNVSNTIIDPSSHMGYLKLQTPEDECYMSFVVVDQMPDDMTNTHLFQKAQYFSFPVEFHVKAQFQDKEQTLRRVAMAQQRFKVTDEEMMQAGAEEDDAVSKNRYMLNRLKNGLKNEDIAYMKWIATFVVTGKTKEQCRARANNVISSMKNAGISCVRPIADQLQLFYKFLHGQPLLFEKSWVQETGHNGFAENLFAVGNQLGTNIGFYLGRVDRSTEKVTLEQAISNSRDLVLFHPFIANEGISGSSTDSPHIAITGQTGKGKSFLVKMLMMYLTFLDTKLLITDPKNEIEEWFRNSISDPADRAKYPGFTELIESFNYITLDPSNKENWGVLDPIVFLKGYEANQTSQAVIEQIYTLDGKDDVKTEILKALTHVIEERARGEKVGFMHVIEHLQKSDEKSIRSCGELLSQMVQNSVLQLIFSYGDAKTVQLNEKVNVLQLQGLDLPKEDDDPNYYTDSERKSLCLMIPLAKFCEKFGSQSRHENTSIIFDEAWMLTNARGGKKLIKSLRRIGRSWKNQLYLVTQSVADVQSEDDRGNFGARFAFDEESERDEILEYMGLEKSEENTKLLSNMVKGQCLFRDFYGRTGKLAIDCLFDEWKEAFKTVEKSNSAKAEEAFTW